MSLLDDHACDGRGEWNAAQRVASTDIELPSLPHVGPYSPDDMETYARAAVEPYRQELANIANAARFDRNKFDTDSEFANWAQSRARAML